MYYQPVPCWTRRGLSDKLYHVPTANVASQFNFDFTSQCLVATVTLCWIRVEMVGPGDAGTQLGFGKQGASFLSDGAPG